MTIFDYCISNPPYQQKIQRKTQKNSNTATINIFDKLHLTTLYYSINTIMIYPAGRWWYDIKSPLRKYLFTNHYLKEITYYDSKQSRNIFPTVGIADGINIIHTNTYYNNTYTIKNNTTTYTTSNWDNDKPLPINATHCALADKILYKIQELHLETLDTITTFPQNQAKLSSKQLSELHLEKYFNQELSSNQLKIFANASGSISGKSDYYLIDKKMIKKYDHTYQVCFRQTIIENSNRKWFITLFDNTTVYGNSSVLLYKNTDYNQAYYFSKYAETKFFEYCIRLNIEGRKKVLGSYTPVFNDYCSNSLIDFSYSIDSQLYELFELTDNEIMLIENCGA